MVSSLNPFTACLGVLYQPTATFGALKGQHNWSWLPFVLVVLAVSYTHLTLPTNREV